MLFKSKLYTMESLPVYVYLTFGFTVLLALFLFYKATHFSKSFLSLMVVWIVLQTAISLSGFYQHNLTFPPRITLLLFPPLIVTIFQFTSANGRKFMDQLDLKTLTLFHLIRVPVELVLFWLFNAGYVPELMTFEGRNFDILSGLTAPVIYYFGFVNQVINKQVVLIWNFLCLGLLFNIVINAILSVPTPFQQFAFEQPNIGILYFPFVLLPCLLVPLVLFAHLVSIRQLLLRKAIMN
jgi:hypothetical protein